MDDDLTDARHPLQSTASPTVSRIALVRPERARSLQELLVRMARSGQLRGRVTDDQLLSLLDQVAQAEGASSSGGGVSKITVSCWVGWISHSGEQVCSLQRKPSAKTDIVSTVSINVRRPSLSRQFNRRQDKLTSDDEDDFADDEPSSRRDASKTGPAKSGSAAVADDDDDDIFDL